MHRGKIKAVRVSVQDNSKAPYRASTKKGVHDCIWAEMLEKGAWTRGVSVANLSDA